MQHENRNQNKNVLMVLVAMGTVTQGETVTDHFILDLFLKHNTVMLGTRGTGKQSLELMQVN